MNLLRLDADVAEAVRSLARWQRRLLEEPDREDLGHPFAVNRHVAGRSTFEDLKSLKAGLAEEPLREGLLRWVAELTMARIALPADIELAKAWAKSCTVHRDAGAERLTLRQARFSFISESNPRPALEALKAMSQGSEALASAMRERAEVRGEVAKRLGLSHPGELALAVAPNVAEKAARSFLDTTQDVATDVHREAFAKVDERKGAALLVTRNLLLGLDADQGWPARLGLPWLEEIFPPQLAEGVKMDVPLLPSIRGATSFARGLAGLGWALARGASLRHFPFSVATTPLFLRGHRVAAVLASIVGEPEFHRRTLGLSRGIARDQARRVARALLVDARVSAMRVLLERMAPAQRRDAYEELTMRVFGEVIDEKLCGVFPWVDEHAATRFVGHMQAASSRASLRDRFDEDWWRNPKALAAMRATLSAPAFESVESDAVADAMTKARLMLVELAA